MNRALRGNGGGLAGGGRLTNVTVSGNRAAERFLGAGGGIYLHFFDSVSLFNATVTANSDGQFAYPGDDIFAEVFRDAFDRDLSGQVSFKNSIIGSGYFGATPPVSYGHNLGGFGGPGDRGVTESELNLGPLADNGGPTLTHALQAGSIAIDYIPVEVCTTGPSGADGRTPPLTSDQRGMRRPQGPGCDVGAYEVGVTPCPGWLPGGCDFRFRDFQLALFRLADASSSLAAAMSDPSDNPGGGGGGGQAAMLVQQLAAATAWFDAFAAVNSLQTGVQAFEQLKTAMGDAQATEAQLEKCCGDRAPTLFDLLDADFAVAGTSLLALQNAVARAQRIDGVEQVLQKVREMGLPSGLEMSLSAKLQAAIDAMRRDLPGAGMQELQAFVREVEAQRGKQIDAKQADALIAAVAPFINQ